MFHSSFPLPLLFRVPRSSLTPSQHFLTEFLEVGGMLTLLEIISLKTAKDRDKAEGLRLLTAIAAKGRQYKELLCESFGKKQAQWAL